VILHSRCSVTSMLVISPGSGAFYSLNRSLMQLFPDRGEKGFKMFLMVALFEIIKVLLYQYRNIKLENYD
jgi:hypothetical protein